MQRGRRARGVVLCLVLISAFGAVTMSRPAHGQTPGATAAAMPPPRSEAVFSGGRRFKNIRGSERDLIQAAAGAQGYGTPAEIDATFYHLSDVLLARQLVLAAQAGVSVHVLLDGSSPSLGCHHASGCENRAFTALTVLNSYYSYGANDWLRTCDGIGPNQSREVPGSGNGCLGSTRNHNKFILASAAGWTNTPDRDVVLQTSSNNTASSYNDEINDEFISYNQPALYDDYERYFNVLASAYALTSPPPISVFHSRLGYSADTTTVATHDISTWSFPEPPGVDPLAKILATVPATAGCPNPRGDQWAPRRMRIGVAMSRIAGRGAVIAQLARLSAEGCEVGVAYARIGNGDRRILAKYGVSLYPVCPAAGPFVHSKFVLINGAVVGVGTNVRMVLTGSDNLDDEGLVRTDDRMLRYVEPAGDSEVYNAYAAQFTRLTDIALHEQQAPGGCGDG